MVWVFASPQHSPVRCWGWVGVVARSCEAGCRGWRPRLNSNAKQPRRQPALIFFVETLRYCPSGRRAVGPEALPACAECEIALRAYTRMEHTGPQYPISPGPEKAPLPLGEPWKLLLAQRGRQTDVRLDLVMQS